MVVEALAPESSKSRRWMIVRAVLLGAAMPAVWALARWDVLPHIPVCLFQRFTGLPCPGCGMTRSMLRLSQGDAVQSFLMHPLGIVLAALLVAAFLGTVVGLVRGGDPVVRFIERRGVPVSVALVAALVVVWVLRAFVVPSWAPPDPMHDAPVVRHAPSTSRGPGSSDTSGR